MTIDEYNDLYKRGFKGPPPKALVRKIREYYYVKGYSYDQLDELEWIPFTRSVTAKVLNPINWPGIGPTEHKGEKPKPGRKKSRFWDYEEEMKKMREEGATYKEIGDRFGCTPPAARKIVLHGTKSEKKL